MSSAVSVPDGVKVEKAASTAASASSRAFNRSYSISAELLNVCLPIFPLSVLNTLLIALAPPPRTAPPTADCITSEVVWLASFTAPMYAEEAAEPASAPVAALAMSSAVPPSAAVLAAEPAADTMALVTSG